MFVSCTLRSIQNNISNWKGGGVGERIGKMIHCMSNEMASQAGVANTAAEGYE